MKAESILKMLDEEFQKAKDGYKFHRQSGDKYGLTQYFNGRRSQVMTIKRKLKKII